MDRVKVRELQKWFMSHIAEDGKPYSVDKNQAKIVLDVHKNTLVTARAGSGKTRTIVAKIVYLLTHENIDAKEIIVFSFNRKARAEINERLTRITFDGTPLFEYPPEIATTFHGFAYKILGGKERIGNSLITETENLELIQKAVSSANPEIVAQFATSGAKPEKALQFITRAEQQFFKDYNLLQEKIKQLEDTDIKTNLENLYQILLHYKKSLKQKGKTNFNEMMFHAAEKIRKENLEFPYKYIFVDEYQDFSKLFLNLILALRSRVPDSKLLAVGDDWQAINRFAGSDVKYFKNFNKYFPEDSAKLFIPTNYRSGKTIVKNANYFMGKCMKDYKGCKTGNKTHAEIFIKNMLFENYQTTILKIIKKNPNKTIKILSRNNDLNFERISLLDFTEQIRQNLAKEYPEQNLENLISESTIHRSKGLESDIVILLEIDAGKFPGPDKSGGLYEIFGDTAENLFLDEARLFYVALTRPKEKLYILSKTTKIRKETKNYNFLSYLNDEWIEEL